MSTEPPLRVAGGGLMARTAKASGCDVVREDRGFSVGQRSCTTRLALMNAPTTPDGAAQSERAPLLNIANALTVLRLLLVPVFIWLSLLAGGSGQARRGRGLRRGGLHGPS